MTHSQQKTIGHFIGGKKVTGKGERMGEVYNPATGKVQAMVAYATQDEVKLAIDAAAQAFPAWSSTPPLWWTSGRSRPCCGHLGASTRGHVFTSQTDSPRFLGRDRFPSYGEKFNPIRWFRFFLLFFLVFHVLLVRPLRL